MAVTKLSELPLITSTLNDDLVYLVRDGTSNRVTVETLIHNLANTSISGNISFASADYLAGYGNIDINTTLTFLDAQNVRENIVYLPDGAEGQLKIISLFTANGGNTYVEGNFNPPGQRLVFNTIGDSSLLVYSLGKWNMISVTQPYVSASTFTAVLNTANVTETPPNLYFSNARARYAIEAIDSTIDYNRFTGTIRANVSAIARNANTTDVLPEGQFNKYYSNARVAVFIQPFLTTANVRERSSNLYFTNQRAIDAVTPLLDTANVTETAPFFYATNNRVRTALSAGDATILYSSVDGTIRANLLNVAVSLGNTDLILEGSVNKYFSNARSRLAFTPGNNIVIEANGRISATSVVSFTGNTDIIPEGEYNLYYTDSRVVGAATPVLTTANVVEVSNLYFTNARSVGALTPGNNIVIEANGRISASATVAFTGNSDIVPEGVNNQYFTNARVITVVTPLLNTSNVTEGTNLYFTNARARAAFASGDNITIEANGRISATVTAAFSGNTDVVPEGVTNKYFTNARARTALTGGPGIDVNWSSGVISIGQNVSTTSDVTFNNVTVNRNLTVYGNVNTYGANNLSVSDNMIYLNSGSINSNPDVGFAFNYNDGVYHHGGFFRDATDGVFKVFENYSPEPDANIFIDTAHASFRLANIQATKLLANFFIGGNIAVNQIEVQTVKANVWSGIYTSNVAETTNLYFTNARAVLAVSTNLTTANVRETSANLYFTNSRVVSALIAGNSITIEANGRISSTASFTGNTNGVPEGTNNLYFTNARARAAFTAGNNITIDANGRINATVTAAFTGNTDVVSEGVNNLYFTNARVVTALTSANVRVNSLSVGTDSFMGDGSIRTSGSIYATGDVYSSYSDENLKDVKGNLTSALDKLKTLTGFIYTPNELAKSLGIPDVQDVGVSAQKVQAIQPEATRPIYDGQYLTVRYEKLIPLIIEAIKELDKKIDDLGK